MRVAVKEIGLVLLLPTLLCKPCRSDECSLTVLGKFSWVILNPALWKHPSTAQQVKKKTRSKQFHVDRKDEKRPKRGSPDQEVWNPLAWQAQKYSKAEDAVRGQDSDPGSSADMPILQLRMEVSPRTIWNLLYILTLVSSFEVSILRTRRPANIVVSSICKSPPSWFLVRVQVGSRALIGICHVKKSCSC